MKSPKEHGKKKHTGRLYTFTMHQKCAIARQAYLEKQSSPQTKTEVNLLCTSRTVRNVLQKNSTVRYAKLWPHPPLTKLQNKLRLGFAKKTHLTHFLGGLDGKMSYFPMKKINLDIPDSFC